jgi:hypothetical protein
MKKARKESSRSKLKVLFSDEQDWTHFDQYHALSAEIQRGIVRILDEVMQRYGISSLELRKKVITSFLFDFSEALDAKSAFDLPGDPTRWVPTLAFLRAQSGNASAPWSIDAALITLNTALHDIAMDQTDSHFKLGKKCAERVT